MAMDSLIPPLTIDLCRDTDYSERYLHGLDYYRTRWDYLRPDGQLALNTPDGFTRLWPTVGTVFSMVISLALLGIAMKSIPVGTAMPSG
jgi:hypothetical protein